MTIEIIISKYPERFLVSSPNSFDLIIGISRGKNGSLVSFVFRLPSFFQRVCSAPAWLVVENAPFSCPVYRGKPRERAENSRVPCTSLG